MYFIKLYSLGICPIMLLMLHADFMFTANCGSALGCEGWKGGCENCPDFRRATGSLVLGRTRASFNRMLAAYQKFDERLSIVAVSPWLARRAEQSPMFAGRGVTTILNGVDCGIFTPSDDESGEGRPYLLHVTSHFTDKDDALKGGRYIIDLADRLSDLPLEIVVAGTSEVEASRLPNNVRILGPVSDAAELASHQQSGDLLPTLRGEPLLRYSRGWFRSRWSRVYRTARGERLCALR